jgi:hypothetical protein
MKRTYENKKLNSAMLAWSVNPATRQLWLRAEAAIMIIPGTRRIGRQVQGMVKTHRQNKNAHFLPVVQDGCLIRLVFYLLGNLTRFLRQPLQAGVKITKNIHSLMLEILGLFFYESTINGLNFQDYLIVTKALTEYFCSKKTVNIL